MTAELSIVLAGGEAADEVADLAAEWVRAGIVEPFLWVRPHDVEERTGEPPRVSAQLVEPDGGATVDLFSYVARFHVRTIRLVVAQLTPSAGEASPEVSRVGGVVADALRSVLPLSPTGEQLARLHRSVVVIPGSGVTGIDRGVLHPQWEANVVISPEDRSDLDRASVFVRAGENYSGHAAAAIVATAGVLRGIPDGALDHINSDSSARPGDVVVARVSIRSIVGDDVLDVIQARTVDPATLGPEGPAALVSWAAVSHDPEQAADDLVEAVLAHEHWKATPEPEPEHISYGQEDVGDALGRAASFNLRTAGAVVSWTLRRGRRSMERSATERIVGTGAGSMVTIGPRAADHAGDLALEALESERQTWEDTPRSDRVRVTPPSPATWGVYREALLASADGGRLALIEEPRHLGDREVLPAAALVPHPAEPFTSSTCDGVSPFDDDGIRRVGDGLATAATETRTRAEQVRRSLDEARAAAEEAQAAATQAAEQVPPAPRTPARKGKKPVRSEAEPTPEAETSEPTQSLAARAAQLATLVPPLTDRMTALQDESTEADEHEAAAAAELEAFIAWRHVVQQSVAHRIGAALRQRQREQEDVDRDARQQEFASTAPVTSALDRAKESLKRGWWVTLLVLLGFVATLWIWASLLSEEEYRYEAAGWATAAAVVVVLVVLICLNHVFYKAFRRYERDVAETLAEQRHFLHRRAWIAQELVRTRILVAGWSDWTRVVAEVLHRPWTPTASPYDDLSDDIIERLPAAMAVARQDEGGDESIPPAVFLTAYRATYPQGWAQQAFDEAYATFRDRIIGSDTGGFLEVDTDMRPTAFTARTQLLEFWTEGEARRTLGESRAKHLRAAAHRGEIDIPVRIVRRLGRYSDGLALSEPAFLGPTATSSTTFALDAFGAGARAKSLHYVSTVRAWLPDSVTGEERASSSFDLQESETSTALRVDTSAKINPMELTVFSAAVTTAPPVPTSAADVRPTVDDFL